MPDKQMIALTLAKCSRASRLITKDHLCSFLRCYTVSFLFAQPLLSCCSFLPAEPIRQSCYLQNDNLRSESEDGEGDEKTAKCGENHQYSLGDTIVQWILMAWTATSKVAQGKEVPEIKIPIASKSMSASK